MSTSKFIIVSHWGYSSKCPENTFPSFDLSIQKGCNHIEFDLQLTKDKIPIVIPFGVCGVTVDCPLEVDRIMNENFDWYNG